MKRLVFIIFITAISPLLTYGQGTSRWKSDQTIDVNLGVWTDEITWLAIFGSERLEWQNADGSIRKTFQINEVRGQWSDTSTETRIQYEITEGTYNGSITIQKNAQGTKALLVIASTDVQSYELVFQN